MSFVSQSYYMVASCTQDDAIHDGIGPVRPRPDIHLNTRFRYLVKCNKRIASHPTKYGMPLTSRCIAGKTVADCVETREAAPLSCFRRNCC